MLWTPETRQYLLDMYSPASRKKVPFDQRLSKPKNRLTFIPAKHLSSVRLPQINEGSPHRQQAAPSTRIALGRDGRDVDQGAEGAEHRGREEGAGCVLTERLRRISPVPCRGGLLL